MDYIRVAKVPDVTLVVGKASHQGTLHLLSHHILFCPSNGEPEIWLIAVALLRDMGAVVFAQVKLGKQISSVDQLYAFFYKPLHPFPMAVGWTIYDPKQDYGRMGVGTKTNNWRISAINQDFQFAPTYPRYLVVPSRISDHTLKHIGKFRSKSRIPALSYLHSNMISITRSSQPMAGIKQNRSVQDEKLVECIFSSDQINPSPYVNLSHNVIMDARPMANVIAQTAMGSGAESSENYKGCRIMFLGIENIHIVRDSRNRLFDESRPVSKSSLDRSGWLRHVRTIIDGASLIVQNVDIHKNHVLVHCSDGWDRTAQLCSLASMCLDPYYRTLEGFCVLIEKEWISFGHKFSDRLGIISRENNDSSERPQTMGQQLHAQSKLFSSSISSAAKSLFKHANDSAPSLSTHSSSMPNKLMPREVSPVFTQFLDCCYQIWRQFPTQFEYSDKLFLALNDHIYSCQFGTFLFNNERERLMYRSGQNQLPIQDVAFSIWDWILSNPTEFLNPAYVPCASEPAFVAEVGTMHSYRKLSWLPPMIHQRIMQSHPRSLSISIP
ncbi:protein-tyrosine phosphatase-like protein [Polychytrium aggregatum]|uniref:protein-tyrosine phosphatase-like protein n=1 Tax=Polychytrium aggregatum TaxID=110093 RepID=UPI0022FEE871|nr:protein-tyrosine phosphatase-like protein [Polychytrium aggregatum]KAI9205686.1 protein-tyrosine phosphatase-like protein [Polychytrium aggregatum]